MFPFLNACMCAVVTFHLDDVELAARTAAALGPYRDCWVHHYAGSLGPVSIGLALCAAVAGELDEAVVLCEETDRLLAGLGCKGLLPQFRTYYADILQRRGSPQDRRRASDLLHRVRLDAVDLQSPSLAARAEGLTAQLGPR